MYLTTYMKTKKVKTMYIIYANTYATDVRNMKNLKNGFDIIIFAITPRLGHGKVKVSKFHFPPI